MSSVIQWFFSNASAAVQPDRNSDAKAGSQMAGDDVSGMQLCCAHCVYSSTEVFFWHTDLQLGGTTVGVPLASPLLNPLVTLTAFNFVVSKVRANPSTIDAVSCASN